jgi:hypothetical protein
MLGGGGDLGGGAGEETLWHPSNTKATANMEQTRKQRDEADFIRLFLKDRALIQPWKDRTAGIGLR